MSWETDAPEGEEHAKERANCSRLIERGYKYGGVTRCRNYGQNSVSIRKDLSFWTGELADIKTQTVTFTIRSK